MKKSLARTFHALKTVRTKKIIHIMKLWTIFSFVCIFQLYAVDSYSQKSTVNIQKSSLTLNELISEIEKQTDYLFIFSKEDIDLNRPVKVNKQSKDVNAVLAEVFDKSDITYTLNNTYISLRKKGTDIAVPQQDKKSISGQITDPQGEPVIGANIVEKGTTNGTITDMDGKFNLSVPSNSTLVVSYIGYTTAEVPVGNQTNLAIVIEEDTEKLDEVVVIGYGVVRKKDLTGSVAAVKGDDLAARKTTQLSTALQGAVAGVLVTRDNNSPGASAGSIKVRGVTTIGDTSPLVIVDGVPGDINQVNPNDVENMTVLKDAASASIYGSRAASGVIVITTKRAKENDLSLNYSFEYGWDMPTKQPEYVGIQRYLEMTNELRFNDNNAGGMFQTYSEDQVKNWVKYNATDPDNYPITDWTDLILKSSAPRQTHTINISGGSKTVKTKASFAYDLIDGLYADRSYERFMVRVNNDFRFNNYLGATLDFDFKRTNVEQPEFNPFDRMRIAAPVYAAVWADGRVAEGKSGSNPYAIMKDGGTKQEWYNRLGGKASLDFTPLDGLKISGVIAPVYNFNKLKTFRLKAPYYLADDPNTLGGYFEGHSTTKLTENRNDDYSVTIQFIANYMKSFGKHDINVMGGYETYYSFWEYLSASRDQYELDNYPYLNLGPLTYRDNSGFAEEVAYRSWFGRVMYNYDNRYLLQANIRYDGSSRFHKDYRWGSFPSFSAGWVASEENFLKNADMNWLSFLKVRASWGTLGNERIMMRRDDQDVQNYYPYQAAIAFSNVLFYQNGQPLSQLSAAQQIYAIQNISWEKTESFDFGLDAVFLNNRLRLTADYYKKKTKDMLLALEIPDYVGFDNPQKNTGDMNTNGYELEVGWNDQVGDWRYGISVNFSDFISKMGDLGGTEFIGDKVKMKGSQFDEWYGYLSDGLYLTQDDVDNSAKINNSVKVGDVKYKDISGPDGVPDGIISSEYDRVLLGGSLPRYMFGGNVNLGYKDFDFSFAFQGVGSQLIRLDRKMIEPLRENWGNIPAILDGKYWSSLKTDEENAKSKYPRLTVTNVGSNMAMSDFWLFNGRYIRLKNITLGYTLPNAFTKKVYLDRVRFYLSANDLLCFSKFPEGWDPEMGTSAYPITKSVLFGVSVNF